MLEDLRIKDEILVESCLYMRDHLKHNLYSKDNDIIPINITKGIILKHLDGQYTSRVREYNSGILVRELYRSIVEDTAALFLYKRKYLKQTSENGQLFEGEVLDDEITDEQSKKTNNPILWIKI